MLAVMAASVVAVLMGLLTLGTIAGQDTTPSASRSLDSESVTAGENVVVEITVTGATQAVVTETLPSGFTYLESSLPDGQVRPIGRDYHFVLADSADNPFTYTVTVSEAGTISGKLVVDRVDYPLDDSSVTIEAAPTRTPTPTAGDGPSASRSLDSGSVAAGGEDVVVEITVTGATQAVVTETLPSGFTYVESSLPDNQVRPEGRDYQFILADSDDNPFTYTVAVSEAGTISGKLTVDRVDYEFDDSSVTVEGPSASRSLDSGSVAAGGEDVVVEITVTGATQAVVTETLPSGFTYVESSLPDNQVRPEGRDYQFILADSDDNPFTYTVTVSEAGTISGKLTVDRVDYEFDDSSVTIESPSTATPEPTDTATPEPTATTTPTVDEDPTVSWKVPQALSLNVMIRPISPITDDNDIASYAIEKGRLPRNLRLDETTGNITGRPVRETALSTTVTIKVCDTSENCASFEVKFPPVRDRTVEEPEPTPTLPDVPPIDLSGVNVGDAAPSRGLQIALAATGGALLLGGIGVMTARRRIRARVKR